MSTVLAAETASRMYARSACFHYKNVTHSHRCVFLLAPAFDDTPPALSKPSRLSRVTDSSTAGPVAYTIGRHGKPCFTSGRRFRECLELGPILARKRSTRTRPQLPGTSGSEALTRLHYERVTNRHAARPPRHLTFRSSRLPAYPTALPTVTG